jgi:thymidylate synthase
MTKDTMLFADYTGEGFDQLTDCIKKIKTSPEDRRIIMSAWNPADLDQMVRDDYYQCPYLGVLISVTIYS